MNVLFVVAEMAPFATSGGLGDAATGIAHALHRLGEQVTVLMPRYQFLDGLGDARPGEGPARAIYHHVEAGIRILFVDDPESFDRPGIYGPEAGSAYEDEWRRWGRFCQTAAAVGGQFDIVHLHDAQAAPTALLSSTPTVFTLHNAAYSVSGPLDETVALFDDNPAAADMLEWYGEANFLKAGILAADQVSTVSAGYARQIAEDPEVSSGLNEFIAGLTHPVAGILNGIEIRRFDPLTDAAIPARYGPDDLSGRSAARAELLARSGIDGSGVIFGMVGRMTGQKGLELLDPVIDRLVGEGLRLVAVGNGDEDERVDTWVSDHPHAVWHAEYSDELSRLVWAGGDSYLMPSKFEPGGLGNLYAMRYGAPPVVRFTGGLATTVIDADANPVLGNGFGFDDYTPEALAETVERAMTMFRDDPARWAELQGVGMRTDWGWDPSARRYLELYEDVLARA